MEDWIITIPKSIPWEKYEEELDAAAKDPDIVLNYRLGYKPNAKPGDRVFVVHDGEIKGFQKVVDVVEEKKGFKCLSTGQNWPAGFYIQRGGPFHEIDPIRMKGFRGIRRMKVNTEAPKCLVERE